MIDMIDMRPDVRSQRAISSLIRCVGGGAVCEVGSYRGQSAKLMLDTGLLTVLYCVDPWAPGYDAGDSASHHMDGVEADFDSRVGHDPRVRKLKGTLRDHVDTLTGVPLDLVYVDANHQYGPCRDDLLTVRDTIRPKVVGGHDYYDNPKSWPGVKRAVNEVFGEPDARFPDSSWLVFLDSR